MNRDEYIKILDNHNTLFSELNALNRSLTDDPDADINDWRRMSITVERHRALLYRFSVYEELHDLILDIESDKDRFAVQKAAKSLFKETKEDIKDLIESGRTLKFEDYRCRDLMRRWVDFLLEIEKIFE